MFNFNRQVFFKKISLENSLLNNQSIQINLNASECSQDIACDSLECVFSKFDKKKKNYSNLAYLEETTLFELELLKQLENLEVKISYNISLEELKIIKHFAISPYGDAILKKLKLNVIACTKCFQLICLLKDL
jgi:hypothetical protein